MELYFIRHGMTAGNRRGRYIGSTDEPLSEEGIRQAEQAGCGLSCQRVFVTPLRRSAQTASILFPEAEQITVEDFREMDFGRFEDRCAAEMEQDADYRAWVEGGCMGRCPGGESRSEFTSRVCSAFAALAERLRAEDARQAVFVVHGGTIMAILERYALPQKDYFDYRSENCGIYRCRLAEGRPLRLEAAEYISPRRK